MLRKKPTLEPNGLPMQDSVYGCYSLDSFNAMKMEGNTIVDKASRFDSIPEYVMFSGKSTYSWRI